MIKGFQGLRTRSIAYEKKITELEICCKLELPTLFRQFVSLFKFGNELFIHDKYYVKKYDDLFSCSYQKFPSKIDFELDSLLSLEEIFDHWEKRIGYGVEDYENGYLRIGTINRGGAIFVGTKGNDFEKIIVNIWDFDPCYFELADNIMEFIKKIEIAPVDESDLIDGIVFSQLYKNWGEDFWRVRENQEFI